MAGVAWHKLKRGCRLVFRTCRWVLWTVLLLVAGSLWWLDRVGLPQVWKTPLLEQVRRQGLELEFSRLRLRLFAGVVADEVTVRPARDEQAPRLKADRIRLDLDFTQLWRGRLVVEGLDLTEGHFSLGQQAEGNERFPWALEAIQARLRFLPGDTWELQEFRARAGPVRCRITGTVRQASALRQWPIWIRGQRPANREPGDVPPLGWDWRPWLARLDFADPPELRAHFTGDAQDPATFRLRLQLLIPRATTPWGTFQGAWLRLASLPATDGTPAQLQWELSVNRASTPAGELEAIQLTAMAGPTQEEDRWRFEGSMRASAVHARWGRLTSAHGMLSGIVHTARPALEELDWQLDCAALEAGTTRVETIKLAGQLRPDRSPSAMTDREPWRRWAGWQWTASTEMTRVELRGLTLSQVHCRAEWSAPELRVEPLEFHLPSGPVVAGARIRADTAEAQLRCMSRADPHDLKSWLPERTRRWLDQFRWARAPEIEAEGRCPLPPWPPRPEDWRELGRSGLTLRGQIVLGQASYQGFQAEQARTRFRLENGGWQFTDLAVDRPDGWLRADYDVHPGQRHYHWRFRLQLPPEAFQPFIPAEHARWLQELRGQGPIGAEGEIWGAFLQPESVAGFAQVAWTNFSFRHTPVDRAEACLAYSNRWLRVMAARVERGSGQLRADGLAVDFAARRIHLTNVLCQDDVGTIASAIGPKTAETLADYHFELPPRIRLDGTVPWQGSDGADLRAQVDGGPFRWWRFRLDRVTGSLHWHNHRVWLTNATGQGYRGQWQGWAVFDDSPAEGTDIRFSLQATGIDLAQLMRDLQPRPSRLEGTLDLRLTVHEGNTRDWHTWNGEGQASLRDGWIWSIPLFGVLSQPLDALVPGLGRSRVTSGQMTFVLTNGVLSSEDLECRASAMRLLYRGQMTLEGRLDAVVQAELLRDAWLVGRVLSLALWPVSKIFEFQITGTLQDPKVAPLHIPRVLTIPLRPWQTLRDLVEPRSAAPTEP